MSQQTWKPGNCPRVPGLYREITPDGKEVPGGRQATLRSARGRLPPTSVAGHLWVRVGRARSTPGAVARSRKPSPSSDPMEGMFLFSLLLSGVGLYAILRLWPHASEPARHPAAFVALLVVAALTAIGSLSFLSLLARELLGSKLADSLNQPFVKFLTRLMEAKLLPLLAKLLPATVHTKAYSLAGILIVAPGPVPKVLERAAVHLEQVYYHTTAVVVGSVARAVMTIDPWSPPDMEATAAHLRAMQELLFADRQLEKKDRQSEREAFESIADAVSRGPIIIQAESPRRDTTAAELRHELDELHTTLDHVLVEVGKRQGLDQRSSQLDPFFAWILLRMEPPSLSPLSSNLEAVENQMEALQSVAERGVALSEERDRRTLPQRVRHLIGDSGSVDRLPIDTLPRDFDLYYHADLVETGLRTDGARYVKLRTEDTPSSVWHRWQRSPNNDEWCLQKVASSGEKGVDHRRFLKSVQGPKRLVTQTIDAWVETGADGSTEICLEFEPKTLAPIAKPQGCRHWSPEPLGGIHEANLKRSAGS